MKNNTWNKLTIRPDTKNTNAYKMCNTGDDLMDDMFVDLFALKLIFLKVKNIH